MMAFDADKVKALQVAYDKAIAAGLDQFTFEQHPFIVSYAGYVLEFLKGRFAP